MLPFNLIPLARKQGAFRSLYRNPRS